MPEYILTRLIVAVRVSCLHLNTMKTQKDDPYIRVSDILLLSQNDRRFKFIQANSPVNPRRFDKP